MKKFIISESDKEQILKMHGFLKEQTDPKGTAEDPAFQAFAKIVEADCLKGKKTEIKLSKDGKRYYIARKKKNGQTLYFYSDMQVVSQDGKPLGKFVCETAVQSGGQGAGQPAGQGAGQTGGQGAGQQPVLDQSQKDILEYLKRDNWYNMQPPPSDFQVENGDYEKLDLTGVVQPAPQYAELVTKYSKYFPKDKFKTGFFVYKKVQRENTAGGAQKVEITAESCKTAIESLYDNMKSPNTYPLGNEQIVSHIQTTRRCAEPANRKLFLTRFGLKGKLKDIAQRYGIKL